MEVTGAKENLQRTDEQDCVRQVSFWVTATVPGLLLLLHEGAQVWLGTARLQGSEFQSCKEEVAKRPSSKEGNRPRGQFGDPKRKLSSCKERIFL